MRSLDNRVALVTGGGSGIGRVSALTFAREGAKVVVADLDSAGGAETVGLIEKGGGSSVFIRTDVTKSTDVQDMVTRTIETYGRLDCALNNAGISPSHALTADCTEESWDRVKNINLKGVFLCMKFEILHMLKQGKGVIINMSSVAGLVGRPTTVEYAAAKHGIVGLTKTAALEYAKLGIRINAVSPGPIRTAMFERNVAAGVRSEAKYKTDIPMGRMGTPQEVAEAVVWLCSDAASFITGMALPVDGGFVAG